MLWDDAYAEGGGPDEEHARRQEALGKIVAVHDEEVGVDAYCQRPESGCGVCHVSENALERRHVRWARRDNEGSGTDLHIAQHAGDDIPINNPLPRDLELE